ncbi:MAG TPA: OsmC family peroxiredoxin [Acidimicrobiales bacterium]|nr:OsmC family peroxiredoxin [Acidimicrobiales bacterium]
MAVRSAHTSWTGGVADGSGRVTLVSSGVGTFDVSFPKRIADLADGTTSPEELIAAAHSACYSMALSSMIAKSGATPVGLEVDADVTLGPDPAGGLRIESVALTVRGRVEGLDDDGFAKLAAEAKATCPVSKALTGTTVTLDAALA